MRVALIPLAYCVGSLPLGLWIVQASTGEDLRQKGSKNVGTSNAYRVVGWRVAVWIGPLQWAQGFVIPAAAAVMGAGSLDVAGTAIAAVLGNLTSPWLGGRGGRGIAVSVGTFVALLWPVALVSCGIFAVGAALRKIAPAVLVAMCASPFVALAISRSVITMAVAVISIFIVGRRVAGLPWDPKPNRWTRHNLIDRLIWDRRPGDNPVIRRR